MVDSSAANLRKCWENGEIERSFKTTQTASVLQLYESNATNQLPHAFVFAPSLCARALAIQFPKEY
jgi:hypothetical protein